MKKYQDAIPHFKKCLEIAKRSSTIARANYWLGRCYSHKDKKLAKQYFAAAAKYDFVFYGQVGLLELGEKNVKLEEPNVTEHDFQHVKNSSLAHATKLVIKHGSLNLAAKYAEALVKAARNHSETAAAIKYISKLGGSPYIVGNAGRAAIDKGVFVKESFPAPFKVSKPLADLAVIYGVIRQESTYDQFALDPLDGRGLMQIMPETCKSVCKSLGIACDRNRLLSDASYNILVGSKLIQYHVKDFRHYVPSILSYNGGENRVKKWITKFGDLRRYNNFAKVVEWIEMVPLQITRTYVQKVLEVAQIYRTQFDNSNELQIQRYLTEKMDL